MKKAALSVLAYGQGREKKGGEKGMTWLDKMAMASSQARQIRKQKDDRIKQIERLKRRILFVIRWSNFDNYWYVVEALEGLSGEYRLMLGDADELIQKSRELIECLRQERNQ